MPDTRERYYLWEVTKVDSWPLSDENSLDAGTDESWNTATLSKYLSDMVPLIFYVFWTIHSNNPSSRWTGAAFTRHSIVYRPAHLIDSCLSRWDRARWLDEKIRTMTVGVILTALLRYLNYITDYWDLGIGRVPMWAIWHMIFENSTVQILSV